MTIDLIRHGQTAANEAHLYCGRTDLPLSPAGRSALMQRRYTPPENCRYATSGMRRAEETLEILVGNVPHTTIPSLREMDFGDFEMHSYAELCATSAYQLWLSGDNEANVPPNGESGVQMRRRVLRAWQSIASSGQNWCIVTHGGVIADILASLFPSEGRNRYEWQCAPGGGWRLQQLGGQWTYTSAPIQMEEIC